MVSKLSYRLAVFVFAITACTLSFSQTPSSPRPNILLIVADDLGYTDLGVYGGDIDTPNIDALAREGVLFSQFHTSPMCAPTRAMLLSGNNNHVAGVANQQRNGIRGHAYPGYEAGLSDRVAPLPRLLRDAGYQTYAVGKWHLGRSPAQSPRAAGFSRSWMLLSGAGTYFDATGFENAPSTFGADDTYVEYPTGAYATEWYTDRLIEFIDGGLDAGKPFFAYAAFTAPHWPLQVPEGYRDLYAGVYDAGYDVLRKKRFASAKAAGVLDPNHVLPPRNTAIPPWETLSSDEQRVEARKMELYAALVHNFDEHVGRLLDHLRDAGLYDNTLIVFMSDNGAAAEDFYNRGPFVEYLHTHFDNAYETMGTSRSFVSYGPQWAEASSAPFSRYKALARQGGVVAPMIIAGPSVDLAHTITSTYVTVMDLAPTILDAAGVAYPTDGSVRLPEGESIAPFLARKKAQVHAQDYVTTVYHRGVALMRQGPYKLVNLAAPFDESKFELFNVVADPGETTDLATLEPDKYLELLTLWRGERKRLGIVLPEDL